MIYVMAIEGSPAVKIGRAGNPAERLAGLQTGNPNILTLLWSGPGGREMEGHLHATFALYRVRGEWFDLTELGDPVAVVQAAMTDGPLLPAPPRQRDFRRQTTQQRQTTSGYQRPTGLSERHPEMPQSTTWDDRFPAMENRTPEPGCIRVREGDCQRPAGTTCDCPTEERQGYASWPGAPRWETTEHGASRWLFGKIARELPNRLFTFTDAATIIGAPRSFVDRFGLQLVEDGLLVPQRARPGEEIRYATKFVEDWQVN